MEMTTIKTGGLIPYAATLAIIAIRAFQPNAVPMEDWSFSSWLWMTLPLTWSFYIVAAIKGLQFLFTLAEAIFSKRK